MFLEIIIVILTIILIMLLLTSKFKVDYFPDFSCEATQNKYYTIEELKYRASCPNIVICEKYINGAFAFFAEAGDSNGPYFSKDCNDYYYLGVSPVTGKRLDLEYYDLYYYPRWNPYRWFNGQYGYRRQIPNFWSNPYGYQGYQGYRWDRRNRRNRKDRGYQVYRGDRKDRRDQRDRRDRKDRKDQQVQSPRRQDSNSILYGASARID